MVFYNSLKYNVPYSVPYFTCLFYLSSICIYVCDPVGSRGVGNYTKSHI